MVTSATYRGGDSNSPTAWELSGCQRLIYLGWPDKYPAGHAALSPQARARDLTSEEVLRLSKSLMQEGGGMKPHRAYTRLTVYEAVSTLNGLRLPYQWPVLFEGTGKALEPPTGLEPATVPYEGAALSV